MKKLITTLAAFICLLCLKANAKSMQYIYYSDSCNNSSGMAFNCWTFWFDSASLSSCAIVTDYGDGSKLDTTGFTGTAPYYLWQPARHVYSTFGTYTVTHAYYCGGVLNDTAMTSVTVGCRKVGGYMYQDLNANCSYNPGNDRLFSGGFNIQVDSAGVIIDTVYAWDKWVYQINAKTTTVYKFKVIANPAGFTYACPTSGTLTYTYTPTSFPSTPLDFGFTCSNSTVYDYSLSYHKMLRGASSPGSSYFILYPQNTSCQTGNSTVTVNISPKFIINVSGIKPAPTSVSGNTVVWTIKGLSYGSTWLYVPLAPKSTTSNGDTACNSGSITPLTADTNTLNNYFAFCDTVRASYDPNEKSVFPAGDVAPGTKLTYTINFENLGNDTAFNIHVQDTLSANLDLNTFQVISSSHQVTPHIDPASRVVRFDYVGINLEDKNHPEKNKGQVRYTINLRSDLTPGTVTPNRAGIYFDGNPVVLTNYAYSRIPNPNGVEALNSLSNISVYPNPADDVLNVEVKNNGWTEAVLSNTLGQTVAHQTLNTGTNKLNLSQLPAGIYVLNVRGSNGSTSIKIEKR
jgi:uncharacterized repeat protein (TIGR01451 family)